MMTNTTRRVYVSLCLFALAFGWIEASVVVYLRAIHASEVSMSGTASLPNLQVALVSLPGPLVAIEMTREACTIILLGAVSWLAGHRCADRMGAFLLAFGIWDLAYYADLRFALGWPERLTTWDILFLIPSPWVAPVWAPVAIATLFVLGGSYLFWTADRERRYRWTDFGVLLLATGLTIAAFLAGSNTVMDHRVPEHFPLWVFWAGVALGTMWFVGVERRHAPTKDAGHPWVGVRVRTIVPTPADAQTDGTFEEYIQAKSQLDTLNDDTRALSARVEALRARLILMGHSELAEQPNEYFH